MSFSKRLVALYLGTGSWTTHPRSVPDQKKQLDTARVYRVDCIGTAKVYGTGPLKPSWETKAHQLRASVQLNETLDAIQELYEDGKIGKFGLSNLPAADVEAAYNYQKDE
ncbi:hypothetical protein BJY01DRAFT_245229 [Aspergillus pseudoustus]|uniref:NADP-dependent oxidoreductase domain-containing protein n=1 Tax=Aspergillus pseudoustus TaxID=1810923 RepID=A0ABR4KFG3_9EURO